MDPSTPQLRVHQRRALQALESAWDAGRSRAWIVLPPGGGKTRVGLETAARHLRDGTVTKAVVLSPNTAIQGQWVGAAAELGLTASDDRGLTAELTSLTYQAVAIFDADDEVADDPDDDPDDDASASQLARLHPNGRALVERLRATPGLLLVLDECHHLLEVWGELLAELLAELPDSWVLGLTATPPATLDADQARLVDELFGGIVFQAGVPALVREGDLAPYLELAHLVTPTAREEEWLAEEATRFTELTTRLMDPEFGSLPFLPWLDERFVTAVPRVEVAPDQLDAALRLHFAGLLALPPGAVLSERHRRPPTPADWVALVDDWLVRCVVPSEDPRDHDVLDVVRRALPAVGYVWTRRGIRVGRSTVDRVLARSLAKTTATVGLVAQEWDVLGDHARVLVLCDHERATAIVPEALDGVLDDQEGSARSVIAALVGDPATAGLDPLLVTGSTVAAGEGTLRALVEQVRGADPALADALVVEPGEVATLTGPWTSRRWVPHVTRFFESGGSRVLVGTRGLLGEGWDARRISTLVDLTTATTSTAVVQTRGRALRVDPTWPDKVALTWSVVCLTEAHPRGGQDWDRLVRKHVGFQGIDAEGDVVDGVGHLDASFSPYVPPPVADVDALNARMDGRARDRQAVRAWWRVGTPYVDQVRPTLRVRGRVSAPAEGSGPPVPPPLVTSADGVLVRGTLLAAPSAFVLRHRRRRLVAWRDDVLRPVLVAPSLQQLGAAVADGLLSAGLGGPGSPGVVVEQHPSGEYRCRLDGADEASSWLFTESLEQLLEPMATPRYVVARYVLGPDDVPDPGFWATVRGASAVRRAMLRARPSGVVWHPVPSALGVNAARAGAFAAAWDRWVGPTSLLYTGSPEGAGVLAAQQGSDPFDATTVIRRHWS
ncbi:DEAD/DEAH box helicase family protein [Nocardioides hankookensis]|uniref:DEAD/DEAH box helicase family protein n=1 Tax=Nocardioides hankookensis TaxID=443157 RepID=A0ABW1LPU9_9ACTN